MSRILSALVCVFAVSCQVYDFEKVTPLAISQTTQSKEVIAKQLKPNLMLLVDRSKSMDSIVAGTATRMTELKSAMNTFLTTSGTVGRMGLAYFPTTSGQCAATTSIDVALPAATPTDDDMALRAQAAAVNAKIQTTVANGGTPTGDSLAFVGGQEGLALDDQRQDFVVLMTDGLPNCNTNNANNVCSGANVACRCTQPNNDCGGGLCAIGCLDRENVVAKTQDLRAKGIKVIVVGFGADTAMGDAPDTLNAMAEAGGFARACPNGTDMECGSNNTCNPATKLCLKKFYQAANGAELAKALKDISDIIGTGNICEFSLEQSPSDPKLLAVIVDGQNQTAGTDTWSYNAGKVTFLGQQCAKIQAATPNNKVNVQFRILTQL